MPDALWAWTDLVRAAAGVADGEPAGAIRGVSIDTRTIEPGDLFVALADVRDGHEFVPSAFKAGGVAALVRKGYTRMPGDGALIRVDDPLKALERIGAAARDRLPQDARVIAVTGSVGKTGTKEMLRAALGRLGAVHASARSYNNHWGVPLTLARMPAGTRFAVLEIGMNHAGEITPLSRLARPHVAVITTVEPVHLGFFPSVEAIADAKAEVFAGLLPGGTTVLNRDNPHYPRLARAAEAAGARIVSFGLDGHADVELKEAVLGADGSEVRARLGARTIAYALGAAGMHIVKNSLAVLAAIDAAGGDAGEAMKALAAVKAPTGRGERTTLHVPGGEITLVDESYNANPASMRAAIEAMAQIPRDVAPRRIAVLGDMLELGEEAVALHRALAPAIAAAGIDLVFASGPAMAQLHADLPAGQRGGAAENSAALLATVLAALRAGDAVMVKGSLGSRMAPIVAAIKTMRGAGPASGA